VLIVSATAAMAAGAPDAAPATGPWLGLNGNNDAGPGRIADFSAHGVIYDHDVDVVAGETTTMSGCSNWQPGWPATHLKSVLDTSLSAAMIPVITIQYCGSAVDYGRCPSVEVNYHGTRFESSCIPTSQAAIDDYARGFVTTASAILRYSEAHFFVGQARFEIVNEPWGFTTGGPGRHGTYNAGQYAKLVTATLSAAERAGIPLGDIYVGAIDAEGWVATMYASSPMLGALADGWYLHPYGLPGNPDAGIGAAKALHDAFAGFSGWDNVIVSELGFCVSPNAGGALPQGDVCRQNVPDVDVTTATDAAVELTQTLDQALPMHDAGWLKAVIVWDRGDSQPRSLGYSADGAAGWAAQLADGSLTPVGRAMLAFASDGLAGL
jgi:hypothetical protein